MIYSMIIWCLMAFNMQNPSHGNDENLIDLKVNFTNIDDPAEGKLLVAVYANEETFLDEENTHREVELEPEKDEISTIFKDLKPGRYSVAVINDQNGNGELDLNFMNIPKEQYGFSNNPFLLGKPKWEDCSFELKNDTTITVEME